MTSGYELTTAITNIFIFIVSLFCLFKIKSKPWKYFYLFMCIDSFMGVIAHGIKMSQKTNDIIWIILSILFTITINLLLYVFKNIKIKNVIILSSILSVIMLIQLFLNSNYLLTFVIYVLIAFLIIIYSVIKSNYKNQKYYLIGFIVQIIGGILMLFKTKIWILNHNGICHLFTVLTLIIFYLGIQKKD